MPVNRYPLILGLIIACTSCIEPFEPEIREQQDFVIINGMISDTPGIHRVTVSRSAPYNHPEFRPLKGCAVAVEDNEGNLNYYTEGEDGIYEAILSPPFLAVGKSYSLWVETPDWGLYRSDFDTLLACPGIDSVYFMERTSGEADPDITFQGIQFFNDVRGTRGGARNFRWIATETWEYHSPYTPEYVWYKSRLQPYLEDTVYTCYLAETVQSVYAASTRFLTENSIYQNKLHYVSDQTPRLAVRYSLLIEQHSLSESAFRYWEKLGAQSTRTASFYETQPSAIEGNMYHVNNHGEKVLGCFYATQVQEKRIFIEPEELSFTVGGFSCELDSIPNFEHFIYDNSYYLISAVSSLYGDYWYTGNKKCFDCTQRGGDNVMPEFW